MPDNEANDNAGMTDDLVVDHQPVGEVKGPDPEHWGEDQLILPPDLQEAVVDYEVKGPAPEHWGTEQARAVAEAERIDTHVAEAEAAGTKRTDPGPEVVPGDVVEIGSADVADVSVVLGDATEK